METPIATAHDPTPQVYKELQSAYDHFNVELFDAELPPCVITLQRKKDTEGYFSPGRFVNRVDGVKADELAINPSFFAVRTLEQCMQTIVHEMAHVWQHHFGEPGRGRYHNKEWADKMQSIGLMPSSTGKPHGKRTGDIMSDYVMDGGPFQLSCARLLTKSFALSWIDRFPPTVESLAQVLHMLPEEVAETISQEELQALDIAMPSATTPRKKSTSAYQCTQCQMNVWGKPGLLIGCVNCQIQLTENKGE